MVAYVQYSRYMYGRLIDLRLTGFYYQNTKTLARLIVLEICSDLLSVYRSYVR